MKFLVTYSFVSSLFVPDLSPLCLSSSDAIQIRPKSYSVFKSKMAVQMRLPSEFSKQKCHLRYNASTKHLEFSSGYSCLVLINEFLIIHALHSLQSAFYHDGVKMVITTLRQLIVKFYIIFFYQIYQTDKTKWHWLMFFHKKHISCLFPSIVLLAAKATGGISS